jgi:fructose-specific phosphotransferase system IIC component
MIEKLHTLRKHLLTGVSYAIPFIACGGIMIAVAIGLATYYGHMTPTGPDFTGLPRLKLILDIGAASFSLMQSVLAGYIAYSIAGRPGLVPGFVGGYLSTHLGDYLAVPNPKISAGFLGALLAGLLAGYIVEAIKKVPTPRYIRPIMPILIIPILSSAAVGIIILKVVGIPIANRMEAATAMLRSMNTGSSVVLALVLGAMIAVDMGGPINKTAFFFGAAMIERGDFHIMGACAAAICTPPLGLGLATLVRRKLWSEEERESGSAALAMGMIGITEGAIPFAAADPIRVIPCIVLGSMVASVIAMTGGVGDHAPHGGPVVLPVIDHKLAYVIAILAGTIVTAICMNVVKGFSKTEMVAAKETQ